MRNAFVDQLLLLAKKDPSLFLLTADLGFSVFEEFSKQLPNQYLNAGVAEQNMTGVAAGLAFEGFHPIIYSIIPFVTMRNFEQIRNDICYQQLPVIIVGVGSGFSYGPYGRTHHAIEDLALMRTLPNMTILSPSDPSETRLAITCAVKLQSSAYIRLGKAGEINVHKNQSFELGTIHKIRDGKDIALLVTGNVINEVLEAQKLLAQKGIEASVFCVPTIKPLDKKFVLKELLKFKKIITIEEHGVIGGLGDAISDVLLENDKKPVLKKIGIPDTLTHFVGRQEFMREKHGLCAPQISTQIVEFCR